jgi:hypothetical protein
VVARTISLPFFTTTSRSDDEIDATVGGLDAADP